MYYFGFVVKYENKCDDSLMLNYYYYHYDHHILYKVSLTFLAIDLLVLRISLCEIRSSSFWGLYFSTLGQKTKMSSANSV